MKNTVSAPSSFEDLNDQQKSLLGTLRAASKKIAPVWPLENFVAVNPYLGFTGKRFEDAAQELATAGGLQMTLPISFYLRKLSEGKMGKEDLATVLSKKGGTADVDAFIQSIEHNLSSSDELKSAPTVADVATQVTNKDWKRFMVGRISVWASSYFDKGQAIWSAADQQAPLFQAWKAEARVDRTAELTGLKGFRKLVKSLPDHPLEATQAALEQLGVPAEGIPLYLHRLLLRVGGWSAYAARLDWDNELYGGEDGKVIELLAVLTSWEACLFASVPGGELKGAWDKAKTIYSQVHVQKEINQQLAQKLILQQAFDLAAQRQIVHRFDQHQSPSGHADRARAQAVFCIDVRSEVYRRNLELVDPKIETLGFAGFFAFPVKYKPIGHEDGEAQCPVLLTTGPTILEQLPDDQAQARALSGRLLNRHVKQVWKSFKSGAVTCFSFVSPMGLTYLPKLFTDSFGWTRPVPHPDADGMSPEAMRQKEVSLASGTVDGEVVGIPLDQQIQMGKNTLTAMSLAENFAPFVLIVGHGSTMVNNPHATGYDCGACGGHTGEANARVAAAVLNNREVRAGLKEAHILIPDDTTFLACLHDTTTDEVTIYNEKDVPAADTEALTTLKQSLSAAGQTARTERALRLSSRSASNIDRSMMARSRDWSQVRPEWGLAGCSTFVVAQRDRTRGIDLEGRSFLHSYDWKKDRGFSVLELIMTAPMVVTSWINLQYFGSTVDNKNFGSGNKTLHNVTAGVGVLEGYSGDLRVGLPMQSIHDGENYQHEPLKLNVIIEAPMEAMNTILEKHQSVRDLCDNGWIHLLAMNDEGKVGHRYAGSLQWEEVAEVRA